MAPWLLPAFLPFSFSGLRVSPDAMSSVSSFISSQLRSKKERKKYFPVGQFFSRSGSTMTVNEGDYLAIPFPSGREVYPIKQAVLATAYAHDAYVPTQLATLSEWETVLKLESVYCKTAKMHAKLAAEDGMLETVVGGVVETSKAYEKGDFILSGTEGERYVNAARLAYFVVSLQRYSELGNCAGTPCQPSISQCAMTAQSPSQRERQHSLKRAFSSTWQRGKSGLGSLPMMTLLASFQQRSL